MAQNPFDDLIPTKGGQRSAPAPAQISTYTVPASPYRQRAEARADASEVRANEANARAAAAQARANEASDRAKREWEATHNPDGSPKAPLQAIPAPALTAFSENMKSLRAVREAMRAIEGRPQSIGLGTGFLGDKFSQWNDPAGVAARAKVAKIGAQQIHDFSGAAVTASESPRLMPFVPQVNDTPEAALEKLRTFEAELVDTIKRGNDTFQPANGYRPYQSKEVAAAINPPPPPTSGGGNPPPAGGGSNGPMPADSVTNQGRWVADPALAGTNAVVRKMIDGGSSAAEIRQYLNSVRPGLGQVIGGIEDAVAVRSEGSKRKININVEQAWQPATDTQKVIGKALMSAPGAAVVGALNGTTMGGLDELASGISQFTDNPQNANYFDAIKRGVQQESPWAYGLGELGGAVAGGYGVARMAPNAARAAMATLPRMIGAGAGVGAVGGALEGNQNRLGGAAIGGAMGAGGGLAGAGLGRALEVLMRNRGRNIEQAIAPNLPAAPNISQGENAILGMKADLGGVRQNLSDAERLNLPYALADADPRLRALAGTVSRVSPEANALAEATFEPRALGQINRAERAISQQLAPITDIAARRAELRNQARAASQPYYDAAFAEQAPIDAELSAMLNRPASREALSSAQNIAANEGRPASDIVSLTGEGGPATVSAPTMQTLDLVKRGFDAPLNKYRNPVTRQLDLEGNAEAQSVNSLLNQFKAKMDEISPAYKQARSVYAEKIAPRNALDLGYNKLPKMDVEDVARAVQGASEASLPELQRGYATAMAKRARDVRDVSNPYNAVYGSTEQKDAINALFPEGAQDFARVYNLEKDMAKTATETLGGSQTARRQAADAAIAPDMMGGLVNAAVDTAATGAPIRSIIGLAQNFAKDRARLGMGNRARQKAAEIAPRLFDTTAPSDAMAFVDDLIRRQAEAKARQKAYAKAGALLLGGGGALSAPAVVGR